MIHSIKVLLGFLVLVGLSGCGGGGGGAAEEAAAEISSKVSTTDANKQTTPPDVADTVIKGESSQVNVPSEDAAPSLTLSRLGRDKLTWNEVVKAGASYLVFERTSDTQYDFNKPIQSLEDVVSLVLSEKPGIHCYIIRATARKQKITVDSNEICFNSDTVINLSLSSEGLLLPNERIIIKADATSNLKGSITSTIRQTQGPTVTLDGKAGVWSFMAPSVKAPSELTFEVTASLAGVTQQRAISLTVLPRNQGPVLQSYADQSVIATESLQLASVAVDSEQDSLSFACILDCPNGFIIDPSTGAISWKPQLDQLGIATPILQVTARGQASTASLRILVEAPSLQLSQPQTHAISGETVVIQPSLQSNLQAPYQWSVSQSSGPQVTLLGADGLWNFLAPAVESRTILTFDLKAGNGIYMTQHNLSFLIDPQPVAPSVNVGPDRITRLPIAISAAVSSNSQTLSWNVLHGPGRIVFLNPGEASTTLSADTDGVYEIELSAMNSVGQVGKDSFRLTWDTSAPQIEVGEHVSSAQALQRTAQVQGAQKLRWSKVSGPGPLVFFPEDGASTVISAVQDGDYVIQLEAEDEAGNTSQDSFHWHFDRTPPTVTLGDPILMPGKSRALSAQVSQDAVQIQWKKISGPLAVSFLPDNHKDTVVTLGGDGVYVVEVSATDALGNTAKALQQLTVDTLPPRITGVTLGAVLSDGYLNPIEKAKGLPLLDAVAVEDSSKTSLAYKIVSSSTSCTSSLSYATGIPNSNDPAINKAGTWRICVKATDSMNLSAYAASPNFIYDTALISVSVSGLPADPSRAQEFQAMVAGNNVSHYKSKMGAADQTDCTSLVGYGPEAPIAQPLVYAYANRKDEQLRLCVIGRTAGGNWQDLSLAYRYDWTLDRVSPDDPSNLNITPLVARARLSWTPSQNADAWLLVRSADSVVTWMPTSGQTYQVGTDLDGGTHEVIGLSSSPQAFDESAEGGKSYHYALFAFDKALNYNMNPSRATTTIMEPLEFNKADGFDRLVRVVLPIDEGEHKGKILVGGDFMVYKKDAAVRLLRLNADLSLDTSFKAAAINNSIYSLAVSDDGSIYIGGTFTNVGGKARNRIARLTATGALDENFTPAGFNNTVMTLALSQDRSRLYAGGSFTSLTTIPATPMNRLAALHASDGQVDGDFTPKYASESDKRGFNNVVWTILPEPGSSRLYVGGQFTDYGGVTAPRLVKLDETGDIDSSLNLGAGFDNTVVTLKMDSKQRLYVGGSFGRYRGSSYYPRLVRLKLDGTPDSDFSKGVASSPKFNNTVYAIECDEAQNKVYIAGAFTQYGSTALTRLARLSMTDASLDPGLSTGTNGILQTLGLTENGKLIGGGNFQRYAGESTPYFFAATAINGALDTASPRGSNLNSYVYATARIHDDPSQPLQSVKYFLAGSFTSYNGETANRVVKLDRTGHIDKSFNSQISNGNVYAIAWDERDQKLYVGGTFTQVNGVERQRLARLNADGSLDPSFASEAVNSDVYAIALATSPGTTNRVIYVGGKFTKYGTATVARLLRLSADGKMDPNFFPGTGFDNNVTALAVAPTNDDHAVYVGGSFLKYNSSMNNAPRLVKLASDGSLANGFEPGGGFNGSVQALLWSASDGSLYVGGAFTRYQSTIVANRIAKLDPTGAIANGFNSSGFNSTVHALDYDADNDLLWVGGSFTSFQGVAQGRIAAMSRNGSRVAAFKAPIGFNGDVRSIVSSFWGVVAGGLGSSYEGDVCSFVARLHVNASMD